ncbi:hypothetical protein Hamer_G009440 [Homarus americanus]|uniref:Uncharacterized protein n=1 Tax=Homarus americanus TaxID=6706 RepID=A0A8J5JIK6_HOMAM|nr:hypothetical protein Hamer_G009440 [Homarus americanus]
MILYGAHQTHSINKYMHVSYVHMFSRKALTPTFKLECLPPTSATAKFHSYQANNGWVKKRNPLNGDGNAREEY